MFKSYPPIIAVQRYSDIIECIQIQYPSLLRIIRKPDGRTGQKKLWTKMPRMLIMWFGQSTYDVGIRCTLFLFGGGVTNRRQEVLENALRYIQRGRAQCHGRIRCVEATPPPPRMIINSVYTLRIPLYKVHNNIYYYTCICIYNV